jgi:hypothetical protein
MRPFVCVVASTFEATTANIMFGYVKIQFIYGGAHDNSRLHAILVKQLLAAFLHQRLMEQCNSLALLT